jgi:hypothetical protein
MGVQASQADVIGPNAFSSNAQVETFDFGTPGVSGYGSVSSNGVTYTFGAPAVYRWATCPNTGTCLSSFVSGAVLDITFDNPVNRVGGYLNYNPDYYTGIPAEVDYWAADNTFLGWYTPVRADNDADDLWFFGLESLTAPIAHVLIKANAGQFAWQLDNFTSEVVSPAAVPGPVAGVGIPGLVISLGALVACWRRKWKVDCLRTHW